MPKGSVFITQWPSQPAESNTLKGLRAEYNALKETFDYVKVSADKDPSNKFLTRLLDQLGNKVQTKLLKIGIIEEQIKRSLL